MNQLKKQTNKELKTTTWNINGLSGKQKYLKTIVEETKPDIMIITETKMKRPIIPHIDIGCDNYDIVQVKSTAHSRGV